MRNNIGFRRATDPSITVVITTYNYGLFVGKAIASALAQDYAPLEVLVMDNASTDDTPAVIASYGADSRLRVIRQVQNIGMTPNHNAGIEAATSDYVVFLSADDFFLPGHLRGMVNFHRKHPDVDAIFGGYYHATVEGRIYQRVKHPGLPDGSYAGGRNEFADLLTYDCYTCTPTTLFLRKLLQVLGGFDEGLGAGDYDLYLQLAALGQKFGYHDVATTAVRIHSSAGTSEESYVQTGNQLSDHLYILEKHLTTANAFRLRGREVGLRRLLNAKIANVNRYPATAKRLAENCSPRIEAIVTKLNEVERENSGSFGRSGPKVSVIIVAGERVSLLSDALDSLVANTYVDWEAVVVSDGGPDLTNLLAGHSAAVKIRYLRHACINGAAAARNTGLRLAAGDVVTYLKDDSRYDKNFLTTVVAALSQPGALVIRTSASLAIESLHLQGGSFRRDILGPSAFYPDQEDALSAWVAPGIPIDAIAHRRSCCDLVGSFNENIRGLDDAEFWLRLQQLRPLFCPAAHVTLRRRIGIAENWEYKNRSDYLGQLRGIYEAYPGPGTTELAGRRHQHLQLLTATLMGDAQVLDTKDGVMHFARILAGLTNLPTFFALP